MYLLFPLCTLQFHNLQFINSVNYINYNNIELLINKVSDVKTTRILTYQYASSLTDSTHLITMNLFPESTTTKLSKKKPSTAIWLMFSTIDVTTLEEVLLFDFAAIVAAVGGSLGLFIGFSFLDVFKAAINKFSN